MRELIRAVPVLLNGLKIGEIADGSYDIESGDELQITSDGIAGMSDGVATGKLTFNAIIPVKGMNAAIDSIILNKQYVDFQIPLNGQVHVLSARIHGGNYTWDHAKGTCRGAFSALGSPSLA